jgi:succinate-semialdehyde dehydrogenase/glutarate-semialdehyde dehydrogenase
MSISSVYPATGETLKTFEPYDEAEVERRLALADSAFRVYRRTRFDERATLVRAMADVLEADRAAIAEMMTLEMGKPVVQARNEVTKCVGVLRYYAEHAAAMLADEPVAGTAAKNGSYLKYQPIGPVLAVMPWNFPLWQVIRFAAPAFMVGNVALLKHASNVPQTALNIEDAARRAGFPEGVFQTLLVGGDRVQAILEDDRVAAAT